ncbi:MAG: response regulator [Chloroflexi bacterium]|nr:response regulator [Chloroflexota bacterium]
MMALEREQQTMSQTPAIVSPAQPHARILIVDDEPANVHMLARLLESYGYGQIISITDPRQLLLSFLELEPDILLLDLHMPHLDGFAVLELLRDWLPPDDYFPIVVLTADVTVEARRRALAAGATDFLTKPVDAVEVALRVEHQLRTRRLHRALRKRTDMLEGQLQTVLDSLDQIVWAADPEGQLIYVSEAAQTVLGRVIPVGDGAAAFWLQYLHPDERDVAGGWLSKLRIMGRLDVEHRIVRPDGEVRWLETRSRMTRDDTGRPVRIDGLSTDVTGRRRLADEVARLAAQRERDRMASELIATVSHELRTPLSSLLGFSELLLDSGVAEAERTSWTEVLHNEARRLAELVDDILDVSHLDAGRVGLSLRTIDAYDIADRALLPFEAGPNGHRLVRRFTGDTAQLTADAEKVRRIITNLVGNALKYSPGGGSVELAVCKTDGHVTFTVTDQGLGMDRTDIDRLFQRFQRVGTVEREGIPGSGLGLYIAKQLVELHGGRIWAESPGRGHGSTFSVELPVGGPPATGAEA